MLGCSFTNKVPALNESRKGGSYERLGSLNSIVFCMMPAKNWLKFNFLILDLIYKNLLTMFRGRCSKVVSVAELRVIRCWLSILAFSSICLFGGSYRCRRNGKLASKTKRNELICQHELKEIKHYSIQFTELNRTEQIWVRFWFESHKLKFWN